VLAGIAAAGLTVISVLAGLAPALGMVIGLVTKASLVTKGLALAQWALNVALTANPIGVAVVAIVALIGVLYLLEKKFGIVTKAWNALKSGMSSLGGAFKDAGGMGVLKIAVDALVANNPMLKILLFQVDFLKKIWLGGETLNKIMNGAIDIWRPIGQFTSWIWSILTKIAGVVGAFEDTATKTIDQAREMLPDWARGDSNKTSGSGGGDTGRDSGDGGSGSNPVETFTNNSNAIKNRLGSSTPENDRITATPTGQISADKSIQDTKAGKSISSSVQEQLTSTEKGSGSAAAGVSSTNFDSDKKYKNVKTGETFNGATAKEVAERDPGFAKNLREAAVGGFINTSGALIGHGGEEVAPARVVVGAKTVLERMSEAAEGGQGGSITVGDTTININVDKMSSDIDLEKALLKAGDEFDRQLMFKLRNLLDSNGLRNIAYMRG